MTESDGPADTTAAEEFDVVVIGSGAPGMAAAIVAHDAGLRPLIVESERWFGGSSAVSAGAVWIPNNQHARAAGIADSAEAAMTYLRGEGGNRVPEAILRAFVDTGPDAIAFLEAKTAARFYVRPNMPDYHPERPGGMATGRTLDTYNFDGRQLGDRFDDLRPPLRHFMILGGMMAGRPEVYHLLHMTRSLRSATYSAGLFLRFFRDRLTHRRGTRLTIGNALVASLAKTLKDRAIPLRLSCPAERLVVDGGRVTGVVVRRDGTSVTIAARRGVIIATGGAPHSTALADRLAPHRKARGHHSAVPEGSRGDGLALATAVGGRLVDGNIDNLFWTPMSLVPEADGTTHVYPHIALDRSKPGFIAVDGTARRFTRESTSYHDFVRGMLGLDGGRGATDPVWLVCDHRALRRYGIGPVPPFPGPYRARIASGYLKRGATVAALARELGLDPATLEDTIRRYNGPAAAGEDPEFGKGSGRYDRALGDPEHGPNPCNAPLATPPFYAVRLHAGDLGSSMGLATDERARVLDRVGAPIPGLYAVGNDMNAIGGGNYPGAGSTLGPGLTFAYIAARDLAGIAARNLASR
ncbi:MAG: FAD-binding protein [Alphaproteobacteria bacterium]|nr:FAD-binding protein [Alphaproteobacteria bacterium]